MGEAGDSGMSGSSSSSLLFSSRGGAPRAADARWRGLGRGVSIGKILRETILGGCSGRGVAAGVVKCVGDLGDLVQLALLGDVVDFINAELPDP